MLQTRRLLRFYMSPLVLLVSIFFGGILGFSSTQWTLFLKPLGDHFLQLLLTFIVPLVFFSVSSAIAKTRSLESVGRLLWIMLLVFLLTGCIASISTLLSLKEVSLVTHIPVLKTKLTEYPQTVSWKNMFAVQDFSDLWSHQHLLPLIIFAIIIGFSCHISFLKTKLLSEFLQQSEMVFMQIFSILMYFAPIGFLAYFANIIHEIGSSLIFQYARVVGFYYIFSIIFFIFVYSFYAYFVNRRAGLYSFWKSLQIPAVTAFATCSSAATIPSNFNALKQMGVSKEIYETVIPLGTIIHKEGSIIGGMVKIVFLFSILNIPFVGTSVLLKAILISLCVGTVMGAIPSGGMLGELLIISAYGFSGHYLIFLVPISVLIDPMATMLNTIGNTINSYLISKFVKKNIFSKPL